MRNIHIYLFKSCRFQLWCLILHLLASLHSYFEAETNRTGRLRFQTIIITIVIVIIIIIVIISIIIIIIISITDYYYYCYYFWLLLLVFLLLFSFVIIITTIWLLLISIIVVMFVYHYYCCIVFSPSSFKVLICSSTCFLDSACYVPLSKSGRALRRNRLFNMFALICAY
jgi:hypothetical protein